MKSLNRVLGPAVGRLERDAPIGKRRADLHDRPPIPRPHALERRHRSVNEAEIRDLGVDELQQRVKEWDDQLFRLRIQKSMGQLEAGHKLKALRRDLARVKTVLREKESR